MIISSILLCIEKKDKRKKPVKTENKGQLFPSFLEISDQMMS